jgi:hypothetical protein
MVAISARAEGLQPVDEPTLEMLSTEAGHPTHGNVADQQRENRQAGFAASGHIPRPPSLGFRQAVFTIRCSMKWSI